ncbi:MAG: pilus assembly protein PilM [Sedimentisphaerales bacterium]|nr:pilus assembly protein PilM [Sedimentisphaerales bacterium]
MRIIRPSRTVIGVDVGRRTIKAAQLTWSEGGSRICALSLLPRPELEKDLSRADAAALRRVLKRQGFTGRKIVVAAPDERLMRAALELPSKVAGAPIGQIVRMELSRLNNVAPDSFEMVYWEWRTPDGTKPMTRTLAIGCPHEAAGDIVDIFEAEGFDVVALDVRGAAVGRACEPLLLPAPQITAIADVGWRSTSVQFVCGRSLLYERLLEGISTAELTGKLAEVFGITVEAAQQVANTVGLTVDQPIEGIDHATLDAVHKHLRNHFDKLLDELRAPFSYVNHQFPGEGVKRLLLIGGGAAVPQLPSYVQARLGIDVRSAAPSDVVTSPVELLSKAGNPAMTLAVGLARFGRTGE